MYLPGDSVTEVGGDENLAVRLVEHQRGVLEHLGNKKVTSSAIFILNLESSSYLVEGSRVRPRQDVPCEDPRSEGGVEVALQRGHLREDHPRVPHRVAEAPSHGHHGRRGQTPGRGFPRVVIRIRLDLRPWIWSCWSLGIFHFLTNLMMSNVC